MKLQYKLVNESGVADQDLEMLGPAHAVPFSSLSVKMAGQQVELIENYGNRMWPWTSFSPKPRV